MRNFLLIFCFIGILLVSCTKEYDYDVSVVQKERDYIPSPTRTDILEDNGDLMVFGPKLTNPYTVVNMQQARLQALSKHPDLTIPAITLTHYYVKFKPRNNEELKSLLQDTTLYFYDYPLDREIISGSYYHDPAVADSLPTYQYVSVPASKWSTLLSSTTSPYEILAMLHIPDEDKITSGWGGGTITPVVPDLPQLPDDPFDPADSVGSGGGFPWIPKPPTDPGDEIGNNNTSGTMSTSSTDYVDILVDEAMALAGYNDNQTMYPNEAVGSKWRPAGTITAYDDIVDGPVPLEGVKVRARRWFTTHTGITDAEGNFSCDGRFRRPANYSIIWERAYWDIRSGDMGQAYYDGPKQKGEWELYIDNNAEKSLGYATVHRAAYRMYYKNIGGMITPKLDKKIKIGYYHKNGGVNGSYYNDWWHHTGIVPMIKIYGFNDDGIDEDNDDDRRAPSRIFGTFCHELAGHGVHAQYCTFFSILSTKYKEAWARCAQYYLTLIEYEELDALQNLNIYSASNSFVDPDHAYNFQEWNKYEYSDYHYPPIFIDVLDNYNQKNYVESDKMSLYPDDQVYFPFIYTLQSMIFESSTFTQVKGKLLEYYNPLANITEESLTKLFDYYEY